MFIKLITDPKEIKFGIENVMRSRINAALHTASYGIRKDLEKLIEGVMLASPEYQSLIGGNLQAELGLENADLRLKEITEILKRSLDVSVSPVQRIGKAHNAGINIVMIKENFQDILSSAAASYQGKEFLVPWLEWLLTQGDRIIIAGFHITYDVSTNQQRGSRSGIAVMEKGGGWRVPPEFAGTMEDNFITRAFDISKTKGFIEAIVHKNIARSLK